MSKESIYVIVPGKIIKILRASILVVALLGILCLIFNYPIPILFFSSLVICIPVTTISVFFSFIKIKLLPLPNTKKRFSNEAMWFYKKVLNSSESKEEQAALYHHNMHLLCETMHYTRIFTGCFFMFEVLLIALNRFQANNSVYFMLGTCLIPFLLFYIAIMADKDRLYNELLLIWCTEYQTSYKHETDYS